MIKAFGAGLLSGKHPLFAVIQSVGTQLAVTAINVITGVLTARLLGPEGRGIYAAVTTWPQLLAMLAISGLGNAVVFRLRRFPDSAPGIVAATFLLGGMLSLVAILIGATLIPFFLKSYDPRVVLLAQVCLFGVLTNSYQMLVKQVLAGRGAFRLFNLSNLLPQLIYLIILILLAVVLPFTATLAIIALVGSAVVALLVILPAFSRIVSVRWSDAGAELRPLASYSARAALTDMVLALSTYADRLVLIPLLSASDLGFYVVAYSFSRLVQLAQPAIASVVFSNMSGRSREDAKQLHDYAYRFLLVALVPGCIMLWILGRPLLVLMYGHDFAAAEGLFRVLVLEAAIGVLNQVTIQLFLSLDRPGAVSTIQVTVLIVSLAAIFLLVPVFGAFGAALGLLIAAVVRLILLMSVLRIGVGLPLPRPFLNKSDIAYLKGRLRHTH